ncbi:MAG TPA: GAF domain-containing protein [Candidatus Limnocylindrales bacterium]|nr:GAF domain-containing protein [Candidatus Limnocylindrales bacterium]
MQSALPTRPIDATLSVTKAARLLGVHPNTIRAWSDAGRLRYYRINPRGDRRYRLGDLQRFLAAAEGTPEPGAGHASAHAGFARHVHGLPDRVPTGLTDQTDREIDGDRLRRRADLSASLALARIAADPKTTDDVLRQAAAVLRERGGYRSVTLHERRGDRFVVRATATPGTARIAELPAAPSALGQAIDRYRKGDPSPVIGRRPDVLGGGAGSLREVAVAIPGDREPWGVLAIVADFDGYDTDLDPDLLVETAATLGAIVGAARRADEVAHQLHRADALRRVASDIGSRLDLDQILAGLVEHAMVLFSGSRAAVFLRGPDGRTTAAVSRGLSQRYLQSVVDVPARALPGLAAASGRPMFSTHYRDDPRAEDVRATVVQEGFDTICTAPLMDGDQLLGLLNIYHDEPHEWSHDELETMGALAEQAAVAIKTAQNFERMASWAAQLQSIQQLGARLSRLGDEHEIGVAIATELRQLIDYHNARVYRLRGDDLLPVAMKGQVGEYVDETPEQLAVKFGEGITGWVAEHRIAEMLPDADADPRTNTIPGTEDIEESMLLAPMIYEDQVLGVLVLSKLGLHQFRDDDLRLLVIYASFAAQAFANADATRLLRDQSDALERQLANQKALLQITESILTTLDPRAILDQVAERLSDLVGYDNLSIELLDRASGLLRPLTARGIHGKEYMEPWLPGEEGLATWVVARNEPTLVLDEGSDPRVLQFRDTGPLEGSLICVPLRGREGATGVLTLERLGVEQRYSEEEFELVKLFAAQVSIALQNAEAHRAVEIRAQTDILTSLLNHGTFQEWLERSVVAREPFSLIMLDLDDFKSVNDELGHQAGDRLLTEIARAIEAAGRESDRVFRYGGDEFALVLPGTDHGSALGVAERVRAAIHALGNPGTPWAASGLEISVSMGVATFPSDGSTAEEILLAADRASFYAKRTGRGLIATADEGLAIAGDFAFTAPTPIDGLEGVTGHGGPEQGEPIAELTTDDPAGERSEAPGGTRRSGRRPRRASTGPTAVS